MALDQNLQQDDEIEMTELMAAHLDDVAGGARHSSWVKIRTEVPAELDA